MRLLRHTIATWSFLVAMSVVCLAQSSSLTSADSVAKVIQLTGQVSIVRDSIPWALQAGGTIQLKQEIITGADGYAKFQVSDGSTFEVFPDSRVIFRNNPSNWKDILDLQIGRVKVHIQKLLGGQPNRNRVITPTAVISVRGTIFDVTMEDEDTTLVAVEEGSVEVKHATLAPFEPKLISPGEYIRVYRNQPLGEKRTDKGQVLGRALRAATEALYRIVYSGPQGTPPGSGPPATSPGDPTHKTPPPPPPGGANPPPPPPPPPPTPTN